MAKRPKTAWCNAMNRAGLLFSTPFKGTWHADIGGYWDEIGNDEAADLGEIDDDGRISFASTDKALVDAWTQGALAAVRMISRWSESPMSHADYVKMYNEESEY